MNLESDDLLCVDFDGTITQGNIEYWNGETPQPDEAVIQAVREHYYNHGLVVVWTARPWSEANMVASWLVQWGVPYHGIRCNKGSGDLYVDDKAISPHEFANEMLGGENNE